MITKIWSATTIGLQTKSVECEIDFTPALPSIVIVGLPDKAVQESKERIRSSIKQSGYDFPLGKITVNLAPADLYKSGTGFDLPIAVGILKLTGFVKQIPDKSIFIGELALDGKIRPVSGVLSICLWALKKGIKNVFIPKYNSSEASLVKGLNIYPVSNLSQLVKHLNNLEQINTLKKMDFETFKNRNFSTNKEGLYPHDLAYVRGQLMAKRALEIGASGGHNILFIGQPGSGKTLLARSYATILPSLTEQEILEVTQIYSIVGQLPEKGVVLDRPFRSPHHSSSHIALVGGGSKLRPGEISMAHRGVLFLDEFPEFSRESIEALRQPIEDGSVTISRANGSVTYPSRFYLLAAANPTPSGYEVDDPDGSYQAFTQQAVNRYKAKFSGPIMDRIDIQVEVNRPTKEELQNKSLAESSRVVAKRVQIARNIQTERFKKERIFTNTEMNLQQIEKYCELGRPEKELMSKAIDTFKMSARSYMRILKISRTIADLDSQNSITTNHIAEALQYRGKINNSNNG